MAAIFSDDAGQISFHHLPHQFAEGGAVLPSEDPLCLRGVPQQSSQLGGRKYRGSTLTRVAPVAVSIATSSLPVPRHSMRRPMWLNARSIKSRTECDSPVAKTKSSGSSC